MPHPRIATGVLAAVLLTALSAQAVDFKVRGVPVRLSITESLFLGYHNFAEPLSLGGDPLNPFSGITRLGEENRLPPNRGGAPQAYGDLFQRLNVILSTWRLQLGLRVDTALFLHPPARLDFRNPGAGGCTDTCIDNQYVSPTGLEKTFLTYSDRRAEAVLGDFYAVFGRGLVLSVRKVDELAIDTTILGGKVVYQPGRFKLTLLGGASNIQNVDEATGRFHKDPFDVILGARGEARLWNKVLFGVHATGGAFSATAYKTGRLAYGGTIDAPRLLPWLDLYFEAAGQERFGEQSAKQPEGRGYALYASATAYAGPLTILFEGKQYDQFALWKASTDLTNTAFSPLAYNLPPTAERLLTELDPQSHVGGGRVHVTYRHSDWLSLIFSNALFRNQQDYNTVILDPYAGFTLRWQGGVSHLFGNGGYRYVHDLDYEGAYQRIGWFDWDFIQGLPHNLSIESQGRALFRTEGRFKQGLPPEQWTEGNAYVALKWTPYLIAAAGLEWSNRELLINEAGEEHIEYALFPNGMLQYNITTSTSIRFFAGGQRGGLKCISGVCRVFPAFRGARLDAVVRF